MANRKDRQLERSPANDRLVAELVDERLDERLRGLLVARASFFRGPLPPPEDLIRYNNAYPGCAQDIVAMAKRQSEHRQELERSVVSSNIANERRGQWLAFALSLVVIGVGAALLWTDKDALGLSVILADVAVLAGLFIYSRVDKQRELRRKRDADDRSATA